MTQPSMCHTALQWLRENMHHQSLNSYKTLHVSPSQVNYVVNIVRILEKIDCIMLIPHCFLFVFIHLFSVLPDMLHGSSLVWWRWPFLPVVISLLLHGRTGCCWSLGTIRYCWLMAHNNCHPVSRLSPCSLYYYSNMILSRDFYSQSEHSFHWKLCSHWLNELWDCCSKTESRSIFLTLFCHQILLHWIIRYHMYYLKTAPQDISKNTFLRI